MCPPSQPGHNVAEVKTTRGQNKDLRLRENATRSGTTGWDRWIADCQSAPTKHSQSDFATSIVWSLKVYQSNSKNMLLIRKLKKSKRQGCHSGPRMVEGMINLRRSFYEWSKVSLSGRPEEILNSGDHVVHLITIPISSSWWALTLMILVVGWWGWGTSSPSWQPSSLLFVDHLFVLLLLIDQLLPHPLVLYQLLLSTTSFHRPFSSLLLLLLQKQAIKQRKIKLLKTWATSVDIEARDSRPESSGGEFAQFNQVKDLVIFNQIH